MPYASGVKMSNGNVVIIGFACAGKTTAGRLLAEKLGKRFVDTDEEIRTLFPDKWKKFCENDDEQAFRQAEADVVFALSHCRNTVIACGGGTPTLSCFGTLAAHATVVWLTVFADSVMSRLGNVARPLFDSLTERQLDDFICRRNEIYSKFADFSVATDEKTPDEVADEIIIGLADLLSKN